MEQQLKELELKPNKLAFQAAGLFSIYTLALIYIFKLMGIDNQVENVPAATRIISLVLSYVPFILAVIYVQTKHRTDLGGYMSFGRGFSAGFRVGANAGLFVAVLLVIYYKFLDPSALDHIYDTAMANAGDDANKMRGVRLMKPYMLIFAAFGAAMIYTIFGIAVSLVGAALFKKEKPLDYNQ